MVFLNAFTIKCMCINIIVEWHKRAEEVGANAVYNLISFKTIKIINLKNCFIYTFPTKYFKL